MAPAGTCSAVLGGGDPGWPELGPGTYQSRGVGGVVCAQCIGKGHVWPPAGLLAAVRQLSNFFTCCH